MFSSTTTEVKFQECPCPPILGEAPFQGLEAGTVSALTKGKLFRLSQVGMNHFMKKHITDDVLRHRRAVQSPVQQN
jgi:hypothetical protein